MGRQVDLDDLIDANGVADLLGLAHRNTVSVYQHGHEDMPRPVLNLGNGRVELWLRAEIKHWAEDQAGRTRRRRSIDHCAGPSLCRRRARPPGRPAADERDSGLEF